MKAVTIIKKRNIMIEETSFPIIKPEEVLLKILYLGLCGSDLKTYMGENPLVTYPRIPGHEISARVVEVGKAVPDNISSRLKKGQLVTVSPYTYCGKCPACRDRRVNTCENNKTLGIQQDGAAREFIAIHYSNVIPVKDEAMDPKLIALGEPLSVGLHAANRGGIKNGDNALIIGLGVIGFGALIGSFHKGATVTVMDIDKKKLSLAENLGAINTINSETEDLKIITRDITKGRGFDVVIEAVGKPQTYQQALELIRVAGVIVCIGYVKNPVSINTSIIVSRELDVRGARNAFMNEIKTALNIIQKKEFQFSSIISHTYPFEKADEAFSFWASNTKDVTKIVLTKNKESV